jgi:general secretion pathway protein A
MEHLYTRHFGLNEPPFNITPDPSFLYLSASHREGLAQLLYGINARRGFIVLTGEVGTGKTTLIQTLLNQLAEGTQTALIFSAITSPLDLLRYVCEEFKLVEPMGDSRDAHDYIFVLNEFLLDKYRARENAALIIDEAQNLSAEVLESIRLLSNFETTKDKLLQILLVGQPELTERLNSPELRQLKQRVTLRHHLRPLSLSECHEYIVNRVKQAGSTERIFLPKAVEAVHRYSGGIPRLINVICDNALVNTYALDRMEVDPLVIQEVAGDLFLTSATSGAMAVRRQNHIQSAPSAAARLNALKPPAVQISNGDQAPGSLDVPSEALVKGSVPERFLLSLREALIDAMGPMGHFVLSEQIKFFGGSIDCFPQEKIASLIDSVSREIFDEFIRERFRRSMSDGIKALQKR